MVDISIYSTSICGENIKGEITSKHGKLFSK